MLDSAAWDQVAHLWDCGRAPQKPDHPDHALALALVTGLMAELPGLDPALLARLIARGKAQKKALVSVGLADLLHGSAEFPRAAAPSPGDLAAALQSDRVRAALGRIACMYDGGHLLE